MSYSLGSLINLEKSLLTLLSVFGVFRPYYINFVLSPALKQSPPS